MTLFESDSQYREKATLWRVFSLLPLFGPLAGGRVFRWFAINIPMDLGTGGEFTSDIDIIARLHNFPVSHDWIYKTWEVKVSLLHKDGTGRSLKAGKTARTLTQLKAYRNYGSPNVSLLDVYVCEAGFMTSNEFPPSCLHDSIREKLDVLSREQFGYQLMPFEHAKDGDTDVGLTAISFAGNIMQTKLPLLPARVSQPKAPFRQLADRLDEFFEKLGNVPGKHFKQIIFCRECRELQLIKMNDENTCPQCGVDLIIQS